MWRDGDADAFDTLFDRHYAAVFHFARTMLGDEHAAEEVLQETFLAVAQSDSYLPRGLFRGWLMRIVRNRCLNRIDARRAQRWSLPGDGLREPPSCDASPLEAAQGREEAELLRRFNRDARTTFLVVTHDPRLAARCDRVIELVDGRVRAA